MNENDTPVAPQQPAAAAGAGVMCALHDQAVKDIRAQLDRIEAQTTATNGRVRNLEKWRLGLATGMGGLLLGTAGGSDLPAKLLQLLTAIFTGAT